MNPAIARIASPLVLLILLSGPSYGQKKKSVSVGTIPAEYVNAPAEGPAQDGKTLAEWWKEFKDLELQSLIDRGIKSNFDVRVAQAKLRESRATLSNTRRSTMIPSVDLDGSYTNTKTSTDNPSIPKLSSSSTTLIPTNYGLYQAKFDASYEVDLFGVTRNQVKAARADAEASAESLRNTLVSVLAEIAKDYIQLRQYQEELRVAKQNEASELDTLRITRVRNKAGLVGDLDVANAAANLASIQSKMPTFETEIDQEIRAIAVLVGGTDRELLRELSSESAGLPVAPAEIPVDLPSNLLRRRPDIREAEKNVTAAAARVGWQKSKLFPTLSLSAQYGGQSGSFMSLTDAAARYYSFGPTIEWGLLNYPATKANIRLYEAKESEQLLTYQKTVVAAFQDVENALIAYTKEKGRQKALDAEVAGYQRANDLSLVKYTHGLSTFLEVLDSQRSLYSAQDSLVQSRATVQTDLIALYKALGGGWEKNDPVTTAITP